MAGLKLDLDNLERVQLQPWTCKGKDLWLISIPNDIGVESLVGKKLHINGQPSSSEFLDESTYAKIENKKSTNVIPASTKETSGRLKLGRQCKGEISIRKHIRLMKQEDLSSLVETKGIPEIPAGLKQRWKPFGIKKPPSLKQSTAPVTNTTQLDSPSTKKKHKKRRISRFD